MNSNDWKKWHERFLLDQFLMHQGLTPTHIEKGESPDFVITFDGSAVGIEITELLIQRSEGFTLQAKESILTKIVSKAREIYCEAENPHVLSHIVFSNRPIPGDKTRGEDQIAKLIAGQIETMSRQDSERSEWRSYEDEKDENPLSEWVSFISTCKVPDSRFAHWSPNSAGTVSFRTVERIQEAINAKASRLNAYTERAEEIWLLIVSDCTRLSQKFYVSPDLPFASISSPFARTFYYSVVSGEVFEL